MSFSKFTKDLRELSIKLEIKYNHQQRIPLSQHSRTHSTIIKISKIRWTFKSCKYNKSSM